MRTIVSNLSIKIGALSVVFFLFSACQPLNTRPEPSIAMTETTAQTTAPTSTPTPARTASRTPTITPTIEPTATRPTSTPIEFPEEIYPPALPLQFGAWPATSGCPSHSGLQATDDLPVGSVIQGVDMLLYSGNKLHQKAVSDQALWPLLPFGNRAMTGEKPGVDETWIDLVRKLAQTEYEKLVRNQCGELVVSVTWVVKICPGPCSANASESLKDDLFFILRKDHWLIWAIY